MASSDFRTIVQRDGVSITFTDPAGQTAIVLGLVADIGQTIDPDTGQAVSGRRASVAVAIADLADAGLGLPRATHDPGSLPWRVTFDDSTGAVHEYKVSEAQPDRAMVGAVTCLLETYQPVV